MRQLMTKWGKEIDRKNILPEYPRPGLVRDSYLNLNGEWEYCINHSQETKEYDGTILVPFSPECKLSGVERTVLPEHNLHYRRRFTLPEGFQKSKTILHFGSVDQECDVFLNGVLVGSHAGGYTPFQFDVTETLKEGENQLTLRVIDRTEKLPHARGKQKLVKKGKYSSLFYTPQSGIWKTVWMESVEESYVKDVRITPNLDKGTVKIRVRAEADAKETHAQVIVMGSGNIVGQAQVELNKEAEVELAEVHPWSPEQPYLYDVEIRLGKDKVCSYFGLRKVSVERDRKGILRFFLNNQPCFFNGVLDQGYWPESLMTPPSDEALQYDIKKLKEMGYNTIRKHVKVEPERFYYHCDRLGMFVWQDMPNGGGDYNMLFVTYLPNMFDAFARGVKDFHYRIFKRGDRKGREQYYRDLSEMVRSLYNHPSIVAWVPFNEGWGQFDAKKATWLIRSKLDKTRLINEACGWFDQGGGDMYSIHNYMGKLKVAPKGERAVALTEFGGYSYPMEGHMACDREFGYKHCESKEELTNQYRKLWERDIYTNIPNGLCCAIYTQTSDIEEEVNGVMTYDREEDKLLIDEVKEINRKLYEIFAEET